MYRLYPSCRLQYCSSSVSLHGRGLVDNDSLFTHHTWIGGFFICGAGTHAALFLVVDDRTGTLRGLERVLSHRHSIVAHLNWAIFTGCHLYGLPSLRAAIPSGSKSTSLSMKLVGTSDLLVHHIHAFTIHVTALILLRGILFARSSRLVPDNKAMLGFRFP